jgi:hypothetical protein
VKYGLNYIRLEPLKGLGRDKIHGGGNGGYQTINLAYLFGALRIILLGFDMKFSGNKSHWHGDHPGVLNRDVPVKTFLQNFPALADDLKDEGVEVINATRETALECFPRMGLEEALCKKSF